jgi:hypothetical protein
MRTGLIVGLLALGATVARAEDPPLYKVHLVITEQQSRSIATQPELAVVRGEVGRCSTGQVVKVGGRDELVGYTSTVRVDPDSDGLRLTLSVDLSKLLNKSGRDQIGTSPEKWSRVVQPGEPVRFAWRPSTGPAMWVEATVTPWRP